MGKRKREDSGTAEITSSAQRKKVLPSHQDPGLSKPTTVQIITGSYERVLHGFTATVTLPSSESSDPVQFADTFLFHAHASAIRCLALSPPPPPSDDQSSQARKVILATGSTDQRINLYHLSASPPPAGNRVPLPTLANNAITENPKNRELGTLLHHSSSINALYFPTHSKLLSAAEDNTIAITRTRDWTVLSTIKAPIPRPLGRPSGDTAAPGEVPAGVNDFAVHPSMKLMVSVGKGEKCMRLWNLVTGKKAGVLNFGKELLQTVKEDKRSAGEGQKVVWDPRGEEFAVAFDRSIVIFGLDSKPKCHILLRTKVHQMHYLPSPEEDQAPVISVSTEDGRIIFYSTGPGTDGDEEQTSLRHAKAVGQLGGRNADIHGRIKDFVILPTGNEQGADPLLLVVTGSSDGVVRLWSVEKNELGQLGRSGTSEHAGKAKRTLKEQDPDAETESKSFSEQDSDGAVRQIGQLLSSCETGNRITCLGAFIMTPESA